MEGLNANGGGVAAYFSTVTLNSNIIEYNLNSTESEWGGGGILLTGSDAALAGNVIRHNISSRAGGGVSMVEGPNHAVLVNNVIAENQAATIGGGVYAAGSEAHFIHNTFAHNTSGDGSGIYVTEFYYGPQDSIIALTNTIFFSQPIGIRLTGDNTVTTYSTLWYATPITISPNSTATLIAQDEVYGDPMFVDPLNDGYHLRLGSAAINHGVDAGVYTDLDGNPRPVGAGFDIGAYEFQGGIRYVATTGTDISNDCLDEAAPCATAQHAIDVANAGEQVLIAAGLYTESATLDKPVSLTGVNSATTIIHAVAGQRVLTVTGATISNSVVISGLTFTGGSADYGGGVLITDTAQPLIRDSIFFSNTARSVGGLYALNPLTIIDSDFISNSSDFGSGGAYIIGSATLTGSHFIGNRVVQGCSSSVCALGSAIVVNSLFENNSGMGKTGSAISADILYLTNTRFIGNVGTLGGGASANNDAFVEGGRFERNTAHHGGGLYAWSLHMNGTAFISNTSTGYGGGLSVRRTAELNGVRFISNNAQASGGAIYAENFVTMTNTYIVGNAAASGGGLYLDMGGDGRVVNTVFARNTAAIDGAAMAVVSTGSLALLHTTIADVDLNPKAAIVAASGRLNLTNTIITSHTVAISNTGSTVYEDYNLFFGNVTNTSGSIISGGHSLIGDPRFGDPVNGDYHLRFPSPAIDHGANVGVYTDLDGNPRPVGLGFDIGAYEYQGPIAYLFLPIVRK